MEKAKILVAIRKRPLSKKQQVRGDFDIITIKNQQTVIVSEYKQKVDLTKYIEESIFNFDYSFDQHANNQEIYESAVKPLIESAFEGAKVSCFAYGQTGSGKTFTMNGSPAHQVPGLYTLGAYEIFSYLSQSRFSKLIAYVSFFQIYCGKLFDLLNKRQQLKIREDNKSNIHIVGIEEKQVYSVDDFMELLNYGSTQRVTSQNSANSQSSRSHAILQIILKDQKKVYGKISFIDLAGNERGADHMDMNKQTRIDGAEINKSLLSLKECIRALDQSKGHTPFRGSKLTMVLKDSFSGFCRTLMIGNISPSSASSQNTLNTLRYADRVKQLRKPDQQSENNKEDLRAKQLMLPRQNKNAIKISINQDDDLEDIQKKRVQAQKNFGIKQDINKGNLPGNLQLNRVESHAQKIQFKKNQSPQKNRNQSSAKATTSKLIGVKGNAQSSNGPSNQTININKIINNNGNGINNNNNPPKAPNSNHTKNQTTLQDRKPYSAKYIEVNSFYRPNKPIGTTNGSNIVNNSATMLFNDSLVQKQQLSTLRSFRGQESKKIGRQGGMNNKNTGYNNMTHSMSNSRAQKYTEGYLARNNFDNQWDVIEKLNANSDPQVLTKIRQDLIACLSDQEEQLRKHHSDTLRQQIDTIKDEMKLVNRMEEDRNCITTRQYVKYAKTKIEDKMEKLENLKQMLIQLRYKLDEVEEVQTMCHHNIDDEQLLDGF